MQILGNSFIKYIIPIKNNTYTDNYNIPTYYDSYVAYKIMILIT